MYAVFGILSSVFYNDKWYLNWLFSLLPLKDVQSLIIAFSWTTVLQYPSVTSPASKWVIWWWENENHLNIMFIERNSNWFAVLYNHCSCASLTSFTLHVVIWGHNIFEMFLMWNVSIYQNEPTKYKLALNYASFFGSDRFYSNNSKQSVWGHFSLPPKSVGCRSTHLLVLLMAGTDS